MYEPALKDALYVGIVLVVPHSNVCDALVSVKVTAGAETVGWSFFVNISCNASATDLPDVAQFCDAVVEPLSLLPTFL